MEVTLLTAQYAEDRPIVPKGLTPTPDLERSVLDLGSFQKNRKLPLLKDILDRIYNATDAEYLIYTNVDIALMPNFYITVNKFIEAGYDAFVINRRTISDKYKCIDEIPLMYSETGKSHIGHDCFIFRRDMYPRFTLGTVCVGINWVGRALICNLACHSKNFKEFKDQHLTFHIGNDRIWKSNEYIDYRVHNKSELIRALTKLKKEYGHLDRKGSVSPYLADIKRDEKRHRKNVIVNKSLIGKLTDKIKRNIKSLVSGKNF